MKLEKKNISLANPSKINKDTSEISLILSEEDTRFLKKTASQLGYEVFDLKTEEDRDAESVQIMLKRYSKALKHLFTKYSNSTANKKKKELFNDLKERFEKISLGDVAKLFRDHNMAAFVTMDEITYVFKQVNVKFFGKHDPELDYEGYLKFMVHMSILIYGRAPFDLNHLPAGCMFEELMKAFEDETRARGESTFLYEDPDHTINLQMKELASYNEMLEKNPEEKIPDVILKTNSTFLN